ncbi:MAG: hypothetical protein NDJ90_04775 [Oligoflexia bacterium]|nr:hypothetical protein [Oligoflexia bacterium]
MGLQKPISTEEFQAFLSDLINKKKSKMHHRQVSKGAVKYYGIVRVADDDAAALRGHVSSPGGIHARFIVTAGTTKVRIRATPDASCLPVTNEQLVTLVENLLRKMMKKVQQSVYSGPMDTSNWRGFYLWSTGNDAVNAKGLETLDEAIAENQISVEFKSSCADFGFYMRRFPKAPSSRT